MPADRPAVTSPILVDEHGRPLEYVPAPPPKIMELSAYLVPTSRGVYGVTICKDDGHTYVNIDKMDDMEPLCQIHQ